VQSKGSLSRALGPAYISGQISPDAVFNSTRLKEIFEKWLKGTVEIMIRDDYSRINPSATQVSLQKMLKELQETRLANAAAVRGTKNPDVLANAQALDKELGREQNNVQRSIGDANSIGRGRQDARNMVKTSRGVAAKAAARTLGEVLNVLTAALDPGFFTGIANLEVLAQIRRLVDDGIIDTQAGEELRRLLRNDEKNGRQVFIGVVRLLKAEAEQYDEGSFPIKNEKDVTKEINEIRERS
jgi:intergrase/recombinase